MTNQSREEEGGVSGWDGVYPKGEKKEEIEDKSNKLKMQHKMAQGEASKCAWEDDHSLEARMNILFGYGSLNGNCPHGLSCLNTVCSC